MTFPDPNVLRTFGASITSCDVAAFRTVLSAHPDYLHYAGADSPSWLCDAATFGCLEIVTLLLELGLDVNETDSRESKTALAVAVGRGHVTLVEFLLERGADHRMARPLLAAINCKDAKKSMQMVKLLVEHGADVNRLFRWYDDPSMPAFTPLTWAEANGKTEIAAYLRSKGAVPPKPEDAAPRRSRNRSDEIVDHLAQQFAPVDPLSMQEIVPTGMPIAINIIRPTERHRYITLFTIGMSEKAMIVPSEHPIYPVGKYQYAELLIHLPSNWPLDTKSLARQEFGWPITWLRKLARYPHENQTWLGGPFAIIANDDPPVPLAPNCRFVALMLAAKSEVTCGDGSLVQLYTLVPLYPEEYRLERNEDLPALLRAMDAAGISDAVDLNRRSAVAHS